MDFKLSIPQCNQKTGNNNVMLYTQEQHACHIEGYVLQYVMRRREPGKHGWRGRKGIWREWGASPTPSSTMMLQPTPLLPSSTLRSPLWPMAPTSACFRRCVGTCSSDLTLGRRVTRWWTWLPSSMAGAAFPWSGRKRRPTGSSPARIGWLPSQQEASPTCHGGGEILVVGTKHKCKARTAQAASGRRDDDGEKKCRGEGCHEGGAGRVRDDSVKSRG